MNKTLKAAVLTAFSSSALLLGACTDGSEGGESNIVNSGLPEGLTLAMLDKSGGQFYALDTTTGVRTDLNEAARNSQDPAVQKLAITDTSELGHFLHWPDGAAHGHDEDHDDEEHEEGEEHDEDEHDHEHEGDFEPRFLIMKPEYESGATIDSDDFVVLIDFHGDELAAHTADEYENPEDGSTVAAELERLNDHVEEEEELKAEIEEVLPMGQTLCRAYIDPYLAGEHGHDEEHDEEEHEGEGEEHDEEHEEHGELIHYALTDTGRVYFFGEHEDGLELAQETFVSLTGVSSILDCDETTIARGSDEGVLIFVPDTQFIYFVDAHDGADFHLHASYAVADLMPGGNRADIIAIVGAGEEHDHDHDDDE